MFQPIFSQRCCLLKSLISPKYLLVHIKTEYLNCTYGDVFLKLYNGYSCDFLICRATKSEPTALVTFDDTANNQNIRIGDDRCKNLINQKETSMHTTCFSNKTRKRVHFNSNQAEQ